jgi:hypothetical protein
MKEAVKKLVDVINNRKLADAENGDDTKTLDYTELMDEMVCNADIANLGDFDTDIPLQQAVVHFHGYPFFKSPDFSHSDRREYGLLEEDHLNKHLHSDFAYQSENIAQNKILTKDQDKILQKRDVTIATKIRSDLKDPELSKAMQDYVNCFCKNPKKFYKDLQKAFPGIDCNPVVSMSKTPEHAFKFALAHFEQDKTQIIDPEYSSDGIPQHRLAGVIFVTLHEYAATQNDITLFDVTRAIESDEIKPNPRYKPQLEVAFLGGTAEGKVVAAIPVIFPILSDNHTKDIVPNSPWYQKLFKVAPLKEDGEVSEANGTPGGYNKYVKNKIIELAKEKEDSSSSQKYVKKYCAGKTSFDGGLIGKMQDFYVEHTLKIAKQRAAESGYELVYVDAQSQAHIYPADNISPKKTIYNTQNADTEKQIIPSTPPRFEQKDEYGDEQIIVPSSPLSELCLEEKIGVEQDILGASVEVSNEVIGV